MRRIYKVSERFVRYLVGSASNASRYYILEPFESESGKKGFKIWLLKGVFSKKIAAAMYVADRNTLIVRDEKLSSIMKGIVNAAFDNKD